MKKIIICLMLSICVNSGFTQIQETPWPLKVLSWNIDKAYSGIEYNYRLGVQGGKYPYVFSLNTAPQGLTIDSCTGEIKWTPTAESNNNSVEVKITDSNGDVLTHAFSIDVDNSYFRFVSATGNDNNDGSELNPWATFTYAVENATNARYVYIKNGSYPINTSISGSECGRFLAYPGDNVTLNGVSSGNAVINLGSSNYIFQGFTFNANGTRWLFAVSGSLIENIIWRKNTMFNINENSWENPAFVFFWDGPQTPINGQVHYRNMIMQDNIFHQLRNINNHGASTTLYDVQDLIYEDNLAYDIDGRGVSDKDDGYMNTFRHNEIYDCTLMGVGLLNQGTEGSIEINYNLIYNCPTGILIGSQPGYLRDVYIHHNTVVGPLTMSPIMNNSLSINYNIYNNIIGDGVNFSYEVEPIGSAGGPYNYPDWYTNPSNTKVQMDSNIVNLINSNVVAGFSWGIPSKSSTQWQANGFDLNSIFGSAGLNSAFHLTPASPYYGIYGMDRAANCNNGGALPDTTGSSTGAQGCACIDTPSSGVIFCDDFESTDPLSDRYFESSTSNFLPTNGVGVDGSRGLRAVFGVGTVDAGNIKKSFGRTPSNYIGNNAENPTVDYDEIYWRIDVRTQAGWQGGGGNKLSRATTFAASDWSQGMIGHVWSDGPSGRLSMDPASGIDVNGNLVAVGYNDFANLRWLGSVTGNIDLFSTANSNKWYCVEAHVKLNTPGLNDGIFEFWVNDTLQGAKYNLNFHGTWNNDPTNYMINTIMIENWWNTGSPVAQERYMDNFVISTNRIGCASCNTTAAVTGTDVQTACNSYTWIDGTTYTSSNNSATFNIVGGAASGSDSLVTLNLTINNSATGTDLQTACGSYTWINGTTYTANNNSAVFNIIGGAASGCDSLVTLDLTINNSVTGTDVQTACGSYTWINGATYTANNNSAVFNIIGGAASGCDSLVTLDLTINNFTTGTDVQTACGSYTWINGATYTANNNSAVFNIIGGAASGCDSLVTLDLTITTIDATVTDNSPTLTANASGVSYVWLDCNNNFAVINGEISQNFTATSNGDYAVEITQNGCIDTSACFNVITTGINENNLFKNVFVYPNPNDGVVNINLGDLKDVTVKVFNVRGKLVYSKKNTNTSLFQFNLDVSSGTYFIELKVKDSTQRFKLLKN
jgi:Secretion system C-terminal sorting domain/Putative Ig domain